MITAKYLYPNHGYRQAYDLVVGGEYEVDSISMGQSYTTVYLKPPHGCYNSVYFDFFEDGKPLDIYRDNRFNPYISFQSTTKTGK